MGCGKKICAVIMREVGIWRKNPLYILGILIPLVSCCIFYPTFLRDGLPSDLPIAVVDEDNSSLSRNFTSQLDATQLGKVVRYDNFEEARAAMQTGKVTGICLIPRGFDEDVQASRRPTFSLYVNGLYFVGGALAYQDILTMINLTSGAVHKKVLQAKGYSEEQIAGLIRPVNIDLHKIGNPLTNYSECLSSVLIPGVLQMIIILIIIYSLGSELKYRTSRELLDIADGSFWTAVGGKLLFYTAVFSVLGFGVEMFLYGWMRFPVTGSVWNMLVDMLLLVISSEAMGVAIIGLVPVCRLAMSVGSILSVLSFSFTGFTLPVEAMPAALRGFSFLFPLRYYYLFEVQEVFFGSGIAGWWHYLLVPLAYVLIALLTVPRLGRAYRDQNYSLN